MTTRSPLDVMRSTEGRIFVIRFIKKNGDFRQMRARTGVRCALKGGDRAYDPSEYRLLIVYDMEREGYRSVPTDPSRIVDIVADGETYVYGAAD